MFTSKDEDAVVVAVPEAVGVLGRGRDRSPRSRPCRPGSRRPSCPVGPIGEADVHDVRRRRALVGLVGLDGRDLVLRAAVRVELVDLDPEPGREVLQEVAVVAPGVRQGDRRQVALGPGRVDQCLRHAGDRDGRCLGRCRTAGGQREGDRREGDEEPGPAGSRGQFLLHVLGEMGFDANATAARVAPPPERSRWLSRRVARRQIPGSRSLLRINVPGTPGVKTMDAIC